MSEDQEYYFLKNTKTNMYFGSFSTEARNKPIWVLKEYATAFKESEAFRLQRRLEVQYSPYQKIILEEKAA